MDSKSQARSAGRPPAFDRDEVCERLLALFWERGYDHVSQQQMAAATGLSTSSLYNSFGTKAETYETALRRYLCRADELLAPLEHGAGDLGDLDAFLDRFEAQLHGPTGAFGCMAATTETTLADRGSTAHKLADEHRARMLAAFDAVLRRAAANGRAVPDPAAGAPLLLAASTGILATARATAAGPETFVQLDAVRALVRSWRS